MGKQVGNQQQIWRDVYKKISYLYEVILNLWMDYDFEIIDQVLIKLVLGKRGGGSIAER